MGWVAIIIGAIVFVAGGILYVVIRTIAQILAIIPANQNVPWVLVTSIAITACMLLTFIVYTFRHPPEPIN